MPSDIMWPETRRVLAQVLGERGIGFMQASGVPDEEVEELVELSGRPFIWQAIVANAAPPCTTGTAWNGCVRARRSVACRSTGRR